MGPSRAHIQLVFVKNSVFKIDENFTWALKISGICLYLNFPMLWSVLFYLQWIFRDLLSSSQSLTFNLIQIHNRIWYNALQSLYTYIFLKLPANESNFLVKIFLATGRENIFIEIATSGNCYPSLLSNRQQI